MKIDLTESPYAVVLVIGLLGFLASLLWIARKTERAHDRFSELLDLYPCDHAKESGAAFVDLTSSITVDGIPQRGCGFSVSRMETGILIRKKFSVFTRKGAVFIPTSRIVRESTGQILLAGGHTIGLLGVAPADYG